MTDSTWFTRRETIAAGLALGLPIPALAVEPAHSDLRLWYRQPAGTWTEALPVGNGRLGAMMFGRVGQERLQLNEDTLWAGSPYDPVNPDAAAALPEVRALIAAGKYKEATTLASAKVMAKPLTQMPYGSLGDLLLTFPSAEKPGDYVRDLDLTTAIATTHFSDGTGRYRRELFTSAPDQVVVLRLEAESGTLDFDLAWRGPRDVHYPSSRSPATDR